MLFEIRATDRRLRHRPNQDASFKFSAREGSFRKRAGLQRVLHFTQQIVTDGAPHRVFGKFLVRMHLERAVEIICQLIFKFVAKHLVSVSEPSLTVGLLPLSVYCRLPTLLGLHYSHTTKNLRKFNAAAIDSRLNRAFRYF